MMSPGALENWSVFDGHVFHDGCTKTYGRSTWCLVFAINKHKLVICSNCLEEPPREFKDALSLYLLGNDLLVFAELAIRADEMSIFDMHHLRSQLLVDVANGKAALINDREGTRREYSLD